MELVEKCIRNEYKIKGSVVYRMRCLQNNRVAVIMPSTQKGRKLLVAGDEFYTETGSAFPDSAAEIVEILHFHG